MMFFSKCMTLLYLACFLLLPDVQGRSFVTSHYGTLDLPDAVMNVTEKENGTVVFGLNTGGDFSFSLSAPVVIKAAAGVGAAAASAVLSFIVKSILESDWFKKLSKDTFFPTECRSSANKALHEENTKRSDTWAMFSVAHSECAECQINYDEMVKLAFSFTCGIVEYDYDVVMVNYGEGMKARIRYSGKRGWNFWGSSGWHYCETTDMVAGVVLQDGGDVCNYSEFKHEENCCNFNGFEV